MTAQSVAFNSIVTVMGHTRVGTGEGGGGFTPYSWLYGEAPPKRCAFCKLAVRFKRVGKIAILVYERVTKSAVKWKK